MSVEISRSSLWSLQMQFSLLSFCGKTYPEYCLQKTMPSGVSLADFVASMGRFSLQGKGDGQALVVCLDPKEQSRGVSLMPNISEFPNAAVVCSLSRVLETGPIPSRFFLSSTACAGILHRAEKRGRTLPPQLQQALERVARTTTGHREDSTFPTS